MKGVVLARHPPGFWKRRLESPESRGGVLRACISAAGGELVEMLFLSGEYDSLVIFESPDAITFNAIVLSLNALGDMDSLKAFVAFDPSAAPSVLELGRNAAAAFALASGQET